MIIAEITFTHEQTIEIPLTMSRPAFLRDLRDYSGFTTEREGKQIFYPLSSISRIVFITKEEDAQV